MLRLLIVILDCFCFIFHDYPARVVRHYRRLVFGVGPQDVINGFHKQLVTALLKRTKKNAPQYFRPGLLFLLEKQTYEGNYMFTPKLPGKQCQLAV